jgi:hypothetical protein
VTTPRGAALAREVDEACRRAFAGRGYRLPRRGSITLDIAPECWGWVGLNLGRGDDNATVHPNVGVHCPVVERVLARCKGVPYRTGSIATFAAPFAAVSPDAPRTWWRFYAEDPIGPKAEDLAASVDGHGRPFMEARAGYDRLIAALTPATLRGGGRPQVLTVLYCLTEGPEKAFQYLEEVLMQLRVERSDGIADSVARFGEAFGAMVARGELDKYRTGTS